MWLLQPWFSGGPGRFMAFPSTQWGIDHWNSQGLGSCSSVFTVLLYTAEQQVHFQSLYVDSDVTHTDAENSKNSWIYCAEALKKLKAFVTQPFLCQESTLQHQPVRHLQRMIIIIYFCVNIPASSPLSRN